MDYTIRKYLSQDKATVRDICLKTSSFRDTEKNRKWLCFMYCDFYLEYQSDNCFVATTQSGFPVGYVLCCTDNDLYREKMKAEYLPKIKKISYFKYLLCKASHRYEMKYVLDGYPCHLHIDIYREHQREGIGTALIQTLLAHLTNIGAEGVMLACGSGNKKGIAFYKKLGFETLGKRAGCILFGKRLNT